jgi:hypothetical protein
MKGRGLRPSWSRADARGCSQRHVEGGPCERRLRRSPVRGYRSASPPQCDRADDRGRRAAGLGSHRQRPGRARTGAGQGRPRPGSGPGSNVWLVLGGRRPPDRRRASPSRPSIGGERVRLPAGEERRARRRRSGRSTAHEPAARGLHRHRTRAGATRAGAPPRQTRGFALRAQGAGARRAGQTRPAPAGLGRVRRHRDGVAAHRTAGSGLPAADRFPAGADRRLRRGDRMLPGDDRQPVHRSLRLPGDPADQRGWPDLRRGVRRRDRRRQPVLPPGEALLLGRVDPTPPRVRHHRAPRSDHEDGMWRPQPWSPFPRVVQSARRSSCRSWVGSIFIELS